MQPCWNIGLITPRTGKRRQSCDRVCVYVPVPVAIVPMTDKSAVILLVDTGSSNTWVGANTAYTETSTSQDTGNEVVRKTVNVHGLHIVSFSFQFVEYGSGLFFGE